MHACTCALQVCGPLPPATIQMPPPTFLPVVQIQTRKTFPIPVCTLLLYNYMYTTCMRLLTAHEHVLNCMYTCNPALVTCMTLTTNTCTHTHTHTHTHTQDSAFRMPLVPWCRHVKDVLPLPPPTDFDVFQKCVVCSTNKDVWLCLICHHVSSNTLILYMYT